MRNPYDILGVAKNATDADLKKAFHKLAKAHHPDRNPNDPKAKERFSEINGAYDFLSDKDKRAAFDQGVIDASGQPRAPGMGGAGGFGGFGGFRRGGRPQPSGAETIFETFSTGGRPGGGFSRGPGGGSAGGIDDILADMMASFGGGARPQQSRPQPGGAPSSRGSDVRATARVAFLDWARGGKAQVTLPTGKNVSVSIPAGIEPGKTIRLKGQGEPGSAGAGDALIAVEVEPHPQFRAEGHNIRVDVPVTLYEAVLGAKIRVPTLDGEIEIALPARTTGKGTLRVRGKGIATKDDKGDLLVSPRIVLREGADAELDALARRMQAAASYDPRREG